MVEHFDFCFLVSRLMSAPRCLTEEPGGSEDSDCPFVREVVYVFSAAIAVILYTSHLIVIQIVRSIYN